MLEGSNVGSNSYSQYLIHWLRRVLQHPQLVYLLSFVKMFVSLRVETYISGGCWSRQYVYVSLLTVEFGEISPVQR